MDARPGIGGGGIFASDERYAIVDGLREYGETIGRSVLDIAIGWLAVRQEDPEFAKGIYKDCPRLQHLLDQYPDLRPIFEDPKLVRINFEQVYRDAGGILPEDEEKAKKKSWLVHLPVFKKMPIQRKNLQKAELCKEFGVG